MQQHQDQQDNTLPVAIIGGGPVGLAAAAELAKHGEAFVLFEAGANIASNIESWKHVRVFSPWRYNLAEAAVGLLKAHGWQSPDLEALPTGKELIEDYLRPLANVPAIKPCMYYNARVTSVGRKGLDKLVTQGREALPFIIQVNIDGKSQAFEARAVIDASGTWDTPNPIGSGGVAAQGEHDAKDHIFYGIPDVLGAHRTRYAGKKVMVVGSGHSSINALLDLLALKETEPETEVVWALRKKQMERVYGGESDDALPARGALGTRIREQVEANTLKVLTPFYISVLRPVGSQFDIEGTLEGQEVVVSGVDEVIANTGSRPDTTFLREVRAAFDPVLESVPELAPLIDPNLHSCGSVRPHGEQELRQPEKDFYVVGVKSYGRAPTFLMATGYEQVCSVISALVGDWDAALKVELNLPETGVCSSNLSTPGQVATVSCCGPEDSAEESSSCCSPVSVVAVGSESAACCESASVSGQSNKSCCQTRPEKRGCSSG